MRKPPEKPLDISQEDWDAVDVPEATDEDFARARPFKEVFPEQYKTLNEWAGRQSRGLRCISVSLGERCRTAFVQPARATMAASRCCAMLSREAE
jgi:hypothetical protein